MEPATNVYAALITQNPVMTPSKSSILESIFVMLYIINCIAYTILGKISSEGKDVLDKQIIEHPYWMIFVISFDCYINVFLGGIVFKFFGIYSMIVFNVVMFYCNYVLISQNFDICKIM